MNSMNDSAKLELDHLFELYQFYLNKYIQGLAFFLAYNGALLKFAFDNFTYHKVFSIAALFVCLLSSFLIIFSFFQERDFSEDFKRLAKETNTNPISTHTFKVIWLMISIFVTGVFIGWMYIFIWL